MKAIKASKKLITAIVSFALSLMLCIGVCLAWFVVNTEVNFDPTSAGVRDGDIVDFKVKAYYLDTATGGYKIAETGNVVIVGGFGTGSGNVDKNELGLLEDDDFMRPYSGGSFNTFATAVLFEIEYELKPSNNYYRIFASCPADSVLDVEDSDQDDTFTSGLSNAVGYYGVNVSGNTYSKSGDAAIRYVQVDNSKNNVVVLKKDIVPTTANNDNGNHSDIVYVIMDYLPENFIYLSSLIIRSGGTLTSGLMLTADLSINIGSYDPNNPDLPEVPDPDHETPGEIAFDVSAAAAEYGTEKLKSDVTIADIFTFKTGLKFEENAINTQGKDIDIVLNGRTSISFNATCASTTNETVISLYKDGEFLEDIGTLPVSGSAQSFTIENLQDGTYTIKTSSSARITDLTVQ